MWRGRNGNIGRLGVEKAVWMGRWKKKTVYLGM